jgi:hypothetical protein
MVQEIYIRSMIAPVVVAGVLILAVLIAIPSYAQQEEGGNTGSAQQEEGSNTGSTQHEVIKCPASGYVKISGIKRHCIEGEEFQVPK